MLPPQRIPDVPSTGEVGASRGQLERIKVARIFEVVAGRSARYESEGEGGDREPLEAGGGRPHLGP